MQPRRRYFTGRGHLMKSFAFALFGVLAAGAASGQALPQCNGKFELVRTDTIKPDKLEEFKQAVRDNQAWYKAHGMKDRVLLGQVVNMHGPNGSAAYQSDTALTVHTDMDPDGPDPEHDAAYSAFVAKYKDSSTITSTQMLCVSDIAK